MFDAPIDGWYAWVGLAVAAAAFLGAAAALPTAPPPNASDVAATVDTVAAADPPATARYRLGGDHARVTPETVSIRSDGGTASATFSVGPVAPVESRTTLAGVALGDPPDRRFPDRAVFAAAVAEATETTGTAGRWTAGDTLHARHVSWGETDVTLVLVA